MVARIRCGKTMRGVLAYNESKLAKGEAELIYASKFGRDGIGLSIDEKFQRFISLFKMNPRVKTNTVHISLNFDPSERHQNIKLTEICQAYLDKIGFGDQPYLVYRHDDAAHPHVHIVTTNIMRDGSRIDLHNIGRIRSEMARKEVETEFGLVKAEGRSKENKTKLQDIAQVSYGKTQTKKGIADVVTGVIRDYKFTSFTELNAVLNHFNVAVDQGYENTKMRKHNGLVYSLMRDRKRVGVPIKASTIDRQATYQFLVEHFKLNRVTRKAFQPSTGSRVNNALQRSSGSLSRFEKLLHKDGITVSWAINKQAQIFGVTFVDHLNKVVFKGSDLETGLSANNLLDKLRLNPAETHQVPSKNTSSLNQEKLNSPSELVRGGAIKSLLTPIDSSTGMPLTKRQRRKRKNRKTH